ncbi:phage tail protein [Streptomonospora nanhaiensis]|uniref:phage tail protein n=1 Tax=Streptomonospora nanhaiensis TaxID=1323731 RepID=UPI001C385B39|nr:hypothetical protein [Streptomonospora nanhaiensis]MBV2364260.1 hypothetical protein [Streptomonospora nanhaiensis]
MPGPGGPTVGRVSIRVAPDTSRFRRELGQSLEALERTLTVNIPTRIDTRRVAADAARVKADVERQIGEVEVGLQVQAAMARAQLEDLTRDRTTTVEVEVDRQRLQSAQRQVSDLQDRLSRLGGTTVRVGAITAAITTLGAAAVVASAQVVELGAALAPAAGALALLPAAAGAAGAALGTLAVASIGMGDALEQALTGDAAEFREALEQISPAARQVVREVRALRPELQDLRDRVQDRFFRPLIGETEDLGRRLLPVLGDGMARVAAQMGDAARATTDFATSSQSLDFLDDLFDATAVSIGDAESALPNLLSGLAALGTVGLPYVQDLGAAFDDLAERFRDWAHEAAVSGRATAWIDGALETLRDLGDVAANVGGIIGSIFEGAGDGGLLETIEDLTGELDDFLNTAEGIAAVEGLFQGVSDVGSALSPVLRSLVSAVGVLAPIVGRLAIALGPVLTTAIDGLTPALAELEPGLQAVLGGLEEGVAALVDSGALEMLGIAFSDILIALAPLLPVLGQLTGVVLLALSDILIALAPALATVATEIADNLAPHLPELSAAFTDLVVALTPLVPLLAQMLVPVIELIAPLLVMIIEQTVAWTNAIGMIMPYLQGLLAQGALITGFLSELIGWVLGVVAGFYEMSGAVEVTNRMVRSNIRAMVDGAIARLVRLRDDSLGLLRSLHLGAAAIALAMRDQVLSRIRAIPEGAQVAMRAAIAHILALRDRIFAAFGGSRGWLRYAGMNIIYGFLDGIWAAARALWDALAYIARVTREYFPFSPAKRGPLRTHPMDEAGRNIAEMLAGGITAGERLVVQASDRLAAAAVAPTLAPPDVEGAAERAVEQSTALAALAAAVEALGDRDVVLVVDGEEIARATERGQRQLARR